MLTDKFKRFKTLVDKQGCTSVAEAISMSKGLVSRVYHGKYESDPERIMDLVLAACGGEPGPEAVPDGYMVDSLGRLVRIECVKKIDLARDELVKRLTQKAVAKAAEMAALRIELLAAIDEFCTQSAAVYDKELGGIKGNVSLKTYDGKYQVRRCSADILAHDERLQIAKELVDQCLMEWSKDGDPKIRTIVMQAFQVDKAGRVNCKRLLALRQLQIDDAKWQRAMEAIADSISAIDSLTYVRFYERSPGGKYIQIPIAIGGI